MCRLCRHSTSLAYSCGAASLPLCRFGPEEEKATLRLCRRQGIAEPTVRGHNAGTSKRKEFTGFRCQTPPWLIGLHAPKTRVTAENILQKQRMPRKSDSPQSLLGIIWARQHSCTFLPQSAASCALCRHAEKDTSDEYSDCKGSIISAQHTRTSCHDVHI